MPLILPVVGHIHSVSFLSRICTCAHTAAPAQKTKWLFQLSPPPSLFSLSVEDLHALFFFLFYAETLIPGRPPPPPPALPVTAQTQLTGGGRSRAVQQINPNPTCQPGLRVCRWHTFGVCVCVWEAVFQVSYLCIYHVGLWCTLNIVNFLALFVYSSWLLVKEIFIKYLFLLYIY